MTKLQLKRLGIYAGIALAASAGTLLAVRARAAGIPDADVLTYTGYLENPDGTALSGKHAISLRFLTAVDATKALCTGDVSNADLVSGRFQVPLPDCAAVVAANPNLFVDVQVDGAWLGATKLGAVPYALEAGHATAADGASGLLDQTLKQLSGRPRVEAVHITCGNNGFSKILNAGGTAKVGVLDGAAAGACTLTFPAGTWAAPPVCSCTPQGGVDADRTCQVGTVTATAVDLAGWLVGGPQNMNHHVVCVGPG